MKGFCVIFFINTDATFINTDATFINTDATFINTDAAKVPTYGTTVPSAGHICAFQRAILQKGKYQLPCTITFPELEVFTS